MSERAWAVDLPQHEFEKEYMRRWPHADVIPLGVEWAKQEEATYRTIDAPDAEKFEPDGPNEPQDKRKLKKHLGFPCRGCGQVFDYRIARAGHERGCKTMIQKEAKEDAD